MFLRKFAEVVIFATLSLSMIYFGFGPVMTVASVFVWLGVPTELVSFAAVIALVPASFFATAFILANRPEKLQF